MGGTRAAGSALCSKQPAAGRPRQNACRAPVPNVDTLATMTPPYPAQMKKPLPLGGQVEQAAPCLSGTWPCASSEHRAWHSPSAQGLFAANQLMEGGTDSPGF